MGKVSSEASDEANGAADKDDFLDLVAAANEPILAGADGEKGHTFRPGSNGADSERQRCGRRR
jgi:hypothetical protein